MAQASDTVRVTFQQSGAAPITSESAPGTSLLAAAQNAGMPLEGTCEGQMACSTCHVIVAPEWFARLAEPSEEEEDMLDLAAGVSATSRLACQIALSAELDGLEVTIPDERHDMSDM